ncbi:MAG: hypothetical protein IK004_05555 [Bacteroidales bacterium]|nr:hypothetical protein [Bacteroidales bacterium]
MRRLVLVIVIILGWTFEMNAQLPYWVKITPTPKSGNFYYRVTIAEGRNYKDAYAEAFAMAVYESYSKLTGIGVNIEKTNQETIKEGVFESISTDSGQIRIPINKVCEYEERVVTSNKIKLYVLWQVANNSIDDPQFENFTKCE